MQSYVYLDYVNYILTKHCNTYISATNTCNLKEVLNHDKQAHIKTESLVRMYTIQHLSTFEMQRLVGMSRTGIMKRLKKAGITANAGAWVNVICDFCGAEHQTERSKWRKSIKHYCKKECYYADRENPGYKPWRQGQLARAIVSHNILPSRLGM